ncbi:putative ferric reductase domain-containing transmembrane protein [Magnetofaba australis IT-1]|uniref:Protein-methionine-sulfoxide reductase heme-binding subunit MsrQ n=2 Tax=Magnetofaba TaxID=1472292 RepID=A0A1Y2K624_9PROT|nr:putative ferric reductase domain-containing transmembrane protein [Magnetofaba australis IT-1]
MWQGTLGANPIEFILRNLGDWTLYLLLMTLAVTPLSAWAPLAFLRRYRRMLGLYTFFYALLHGLSYIGLDRFFDWELLWLDVVDRKFMTAGMAAFLLLIPLAATSNAAMIHQLGGARWRRLHRLVYAIAILGVAHFFWLTRADFREPQKMAAILAFLLGWRLLDWMRKRHVPS